MSALLSFFSGPLGRWLAISLMLVAFGGFCFVKGAQHEETKEAARQLAQERANTALTTKRIAATDKVDAKYTPQIAQIRTVTKTIVQKVPVYVPATDPALSGGFRLLHDAAALGMPLPDPASIPDAAPVAAQDVAATVADNYGSCRETAKQLEGLQEWVREQQALNPKE